MRDFSLVFDAYTQFEETMISAQMQPEGAAAAAGPAGGEEGEEDDDELELRLARLQHLLDRRCGPRAARV